MSGVLSCKCPRCHEGNMFKHNLVAKPTKFLEMNTVCPVCNLNLEPEPGYYYGAMFVSYAFAIIELVFILLFIKVLYGPLSTNPLMIMISVIFLLLAPVNFRWGRAGWIALFFRHDLRAGKTHS